MSHVVSRCAAACCALVSVPAPPSNSHYRPPGSGLPPVVA
jgi:hypothetical protein